MEWNPEEYIKTKTLEAMIVSSCIELNRKLFNDPKIDIKKEIMCSIDQLVIRLTDYVWTDDIESRTFKVEYPRDWKEAIKERFLPKFILKRYPVKKTIIKKKFTVKAIYPKIKHDIDLGPYKLRIYEGLDYEIDR